VDEEDYRKGGGSLSSLYDESLQLGAAREKRKRFSPAFLEINSPWKGGLLRLRLKRQRRSLETKRMMGFLEDNFLLLLDKMR